ncbi:hypothetical protein KSF_100240 [Reticulibacter mediterranei]|uniref:DUF302 domain-containing protein n=1 Tax=Reticulibacter mediterranei TaxID=2778369 RepID=A0A8J3J1N6_9CHLR|nr:hypothetical protein KSF_100240 [Reticulibacter mediterranei]
MELDHTVGALLPCNVVVHEAHSPRGAAWTQVDIADPVAMLSVIQNPAMQELAREACARLEHAIVELQTGKE